MKSVRQIVVQSLIALEAREGWSHVVLDSEARRHNLQGKDAAFFSALFYGVLERRITLDACIAAHSNIRLKKLSPPVLQSLRVGIYQLLYMDSVPAHAAVDESVQLTRRLGQTKASGFVNGVLRSFLRADCEIPLKGEGAERWSVEYSCPQPLVEFWLQSYGQQATQQVLQQSLGRSPQYIRINPLRTSAQQLSALLEAHGAQVRQDGLLELCLEVVYGGALHTLPEYRQGLFHIQDKASQLCAEAVGAQPGHRVLDACAAPGGKSFTMAQQMAGSGQLVAMELHPQRAQRMEHRGAEMGFDWMQIKTWDASQPLAELGMFDRILCDVPCSGLGVIRRKPEIKYKQLEEFAQLPQIQYKILQTTAQYCKVGGRVVYSTCTLSPKENEQVVERFLAENPQFSPVPLGGPLGEQCSRTLLGEMGADGFFIAALGRER